MFYWYDIHQNDQVVGLKKILMMLMLMLIIMMLRMLMEVTLLHWRCRKALAHH